MSLTAATRRFNVEVQSLLDKEVTVVTVRGETYTGTLIGFDTTSKDICLANAKDTQGEEFPKLIIYGHFISKIYTKQPLLDLREFAEILEKYFPKMVKYIDDARVIIVMDKIRVSEYGVEGTGPMAERIKRLFDEFLKEKGIA
ncbi:MAG: small nuclear ribonucleoprotein (Sm) [Thermoprotei archaeon]|nr:MAG: small nuclear ribonucleoprotein (Sm) [Thermoprotei archaeon]RLF02543.1 MAG: small nuclear ribonucleoprotein (Sm) [Thermoprotei archaeon]